MYRIDSYRLQNINSVPPELANLKNTSSISNFLLDNCDYMNESAALKHCHSGSMDEKSLYKNTSLHSATQWDADRSVTLLCDWLAEGGHLMENRDTTTPAAPSAQSASAL